MRACDVVVIGAGAVGSATAWWLARRGVEVILLEQFEQGHRRGSSHGTTRIFRLAYPDPLYVDMARRALPLWREMEDDAGVEMLRTTGGIDHGDSASLQPIVDALSRVGVRHEVVDAREAAARWPGFAFDGPVLHQAGAGRIYADATVRSLQTRAGAHGAELHFEEPVRAVSPRSEDRVAVSTDDEQYLARAAVVTAGAWVAELLAGVVALPPLTVTREQVFHFPTRVADGWPSFIHHTYTFVYGLEGPGDEGVKVAEHHMGATTTPDGRSFDIDEGGLQRILRYVGEWMPGLEPSRWSADTCLYTTTTDESFVIERRGPIVVGSACSGHGFKFVPLVGRQLAALALRTS